MTKFCYSRNQKSIKNRGIDKFIIFKQFYLNVRKYTLLKNIIENDERERQIVNTVSIIPNNDIILLFTFIQTK